MPRQLAAAAEAAALRHQQQLEEEQQYERYQRQQHRPGAADADAAADAVDDEDDLDELYPGEPDKAVRELIDRGDRKNTGKVVLQPAFNITPLHVAYAVTGILWSSVWAACCVVCFVQ
jgi:hypothetical protein